MRTGPRRSFVRIEVPVAVKQANGSMLTTWQHYISLWAKIETLRGNDKLSSAASWPKADQRISMRYVAGILPTMRVFFNDKIYSILNVNNVDERNRDLILTTETGVKAI
jgi:SPP1 family predicted phage head-tail adaptor